ncbi:MAG TPA: methionyl-tRNA formyltransferase [Candidatus Saccharimonadales bacterium]|jgi:methionyl-tRNA formyltransferase|nr:methionyl-tRNA formyltransferase [Candidatus Saccharimonadales bacterium]
MKLVFCGTPQFAVASLERLAAAGHELRLVVTQPDRPQGRGMELTAPPVKQSALRLGLPVIQPEKIKKNEEFRQQLGETQPDAIIVVGYGRIIPPWMLQLPPLGNINVHASLLPKYRGAAPIQWAIAMGETVTGVTTMRIDEGLDTGGILLAREMAILPEDTAVTLGPRLAELGAELLLETLRGLEQETIQEIPQSNSEATLAPILRKEDGVVDFQRTATEIHNRLRGFQPWPGATAQFRGKNLKIIGARPVEERPQLSTGELHVSGERLLAGCGSGTVLELLQVQPEGRKAISAREFISGYRPTSERLD